MHISATFTPAAISTTSGAGSAFIAAHMSDVMALPGVTSMTYRLDDPKVTVRLASLRDAQLARMVLRDGVQGAQLVFGDSTGKPFDLSQPYAGPVADAARAVASMPGVLRYARPNESTFRFYTDGADTSRRLAALVAGDIAGHRVRWTPPAGA